MKLEIKNCFSFMKEKWRFSLKISQDLKKTLFWKYSKFFWSLKNLIYFFI